MALTIPNEASAGFSPQSAPDSVDFDIMAAARDGTGVLSGCAVTAQGAPNMTVAVAAGVAATQGREIGVVGANGTITAADVTNPRFDLVVISSAGVLTVRAGTAAAAPVFPTPTAGDVVLASVYVTANATVINTNQITDKRMLTRTFSADPRVYAELVEDFYGSTIVSGEAGTHGWEVSAGTTNQVVAGHPGIYRLDTSATSATVRFARLINPSLIPADTFDNTWFVRVNQTDANTTVRAGAMASAANNPPADGVFFERLDADTNWFAVNRNTSVQTRTDMGVAIGTGWVRLRVRRKDGSTISFSINDGAETDITTNIPTASLTSAAQIVNSAAAAKTMDLDYFRALWRGLTR
jgi:hypothetical protein